MRERYDHIKNRVHILLDEPDRQDRVALLIQIVIAAAIVLNTIAIVIFTVKPVSESYGYLLNPLIDSCLTIFTIEYLLRVWSCTNARDLKSKVRDRIRYGLHLFQIIDLISITPVIFPFFFPRHLVLLRTFRIVSIFKLGRYSRYSKSLEQLKRVLVRKREIFAIMIFFLTFVILFSSTLLYLVENSAQPERFSSIPAAMWWAMMTVTTVGYGDIFPITPLGKIIGSVVTLAGVLVLALPSAILATGFIEERSRTPDLNSIQRVAQVNLIHHFISLHEKGELSDQDYEQYTSMVYSLKPENE